ncbi:MAG TPA: PelD GGDEF domain-containing protein [Trinickia sp.]|uniref:PelD GGDEF domain-containing protein n=1 Tax=Trinickia sp. TaxID=2571163 RepID=UPI002C5AC3D7|nr:PelD GGDEF domain-containing protein [Trinickia sp.]HVW48800.1 PelD GGDEF domain-containing protein [Trinickia sp.]
MNAPPTVAERNSTAPAGGRPRDLYKTPTTGSGRLRRLLAPLARPGYAWAEAAGFTVAVLALAWFLDRTDPLLIAKGFPWLWLVPMIISLRYGVVLGVGSGLMFAAWWPLTYPAGTPWPAPFFVGGFVLTIVAGHFADTWNRRSDRASAVNDYLNERLSALTDNHYLLRLSHERLENDLLTRPTTLRDSIAALRMIAAGQGAAGADADEHAQASASLDRNGPRPAAAAGDTLPGAAALMEFVARACQIEVAALYPVHNGTPSRTAATAVGEAFDFDPSDPLVELALATGKLAHLKSEGMLTSGSQYLVCAPLLAADDRMLGLLVIKRMAFLSLNNDNLQLLLVLLGYYGDGIEHGRAMHAMLVAIPDCPRQFALEYARLVRLHRRSGIQSSIVALSFPRSEEHDSLFEHVLRRGRSLDFAWPRQTSHRSVLVNLMPLADPAGVAGYLARVEGNLRNQFDTDFDGARIGVHTLHVTSESNEKNVAELLDRVAGNV